MGDGRPSNADKHLQKKHGIFINAKEPQQASSDVASTAGSQADSVQTRPSQTLISNLFSQPRCDIKAWRRDVLRLLLAGHLPFALVDLPEFKQMSMSANAALVDYLPADSTVKEWALKEFLVGKFKIKEILKQSLSRIHISFDIWTSEYSSYVFLGVVAHFVNRATDGKLRTQSVLLALKRLREKHTGLFIAKVLYDVIVEYDITSSQIGVFMADNASENDTAIAAVFERLNPDLTPDDIKGRRARCLAHIINLAAKQFLYGKDSEVFEEEIAKLELDKFDADKARDAQRRWREKGPLGKLHNIAVFIRRSSTRKEAFRSIHIGDKMTDGKWLLNLVNKNYRDAQLSVNTTLLTCLDL
jgi:hypothetical protein